MSEGSITPLAQRLAEENNVNWESLQGSGPEGRVIERDVLEYLARVMAGEEDLNPTPEPLPDGLESWESFAAVQETDSWLTPSQADTGPDDAQSLVMGLPEVETDALASSAEAEFELSDDIFLFDEDDAAAPEVDLVGATPQPAASEVEAATEFLDDDFYEDDFLTDLALEDGELDTPEVADVDLSGFGMLGNHEAAAAERSDSDLLGDIFDDNLWASEPVVEESFGWQADTAGEPGRRSLADYLNEDGLAEDGSLQFGLEAADDDAELDLLTGYAGPDVTEEPGGEDSFEVDFSELAAKVQDDSEDNLSAFSVDEVPAPVAFPYEAEDLTVDGPADVVAPGALPLVSHGALLRRHADLTLLVHARQAAGVELGQGEPVSALPFLLRAAARSAHLLDSDASLASLTGAALITENGVQVELVSDAADGSFAALIHLLAAAPGDSSPTHAGSDAASVIACDMSQLQLDEAVLHLDSPLLTLGRVLSDSEQGTYHSTLTLSGTFDVLAGAHFLQSVSELLASPVRLLI